MLDAGQCMTYDEMMNWMELLPAMFFLLDSPDILHPCDDEFSVLKPQIKILVLSDPQPRVQPIFDASCLAF